MTLSRQRRRHTRFGTYRVPRLEAMECRCLLAGDGVIDPIPPHPFGSVHGTKWQDDNGNGQRDHGEPGLAGVTIYADANNNSQLDADERHTVTMKDDPNTDADESGQYWLKELRVGRYVIREIVPDGYVQTFPPGFPVPIPLPGPAGDGVDDPPADEFATVMPERLDLRLEAGETTTQGVSIQVHPICVRAIPMDVRASDPAVRFRNLSGQQINGCGGDISKFEVAIVGDGISREFKIVFFDAESGSEYGAIPVTINARGVPGGHFVVIMPGSEIGGLDFGNQRTGGGAIHGRKWNDLNGNGVQDGGENGVGGVVIYLDRNRTGEFDRGERHTTTMFDDPATDFDEGGLYGFRGLAEGEYVVGEIVPHGHVQTFPSVGARVLASETGFYEHGVAIDLDVTDVGAGLNDDGTFTAKLRMTVVWPDTCGTLKADSTRHTIIGNHILVELAGHQVGNACAEVISPQHETLRIDGLKEGRYEVIGTLHEDLRDGRAGVPTAAVVGLIRIGGPGQHVVTVGKDAVVENIHFGNRDVRPGGSIHGRKWLDENVNGKQEPNEKGLPGVTIYLDLNFDGQRDRGEPSTESMRDDPATDRDESGMYWFTDVRPGVYQVREVVPDGYVQTFPPEIVFGGIGDLIGPDGNVILPPLPFPGGSFHIVIVHGGDTVEGIDFGNQPRPATGSVHGVKWIDADGDGIRDPDERGLAGVVIYADTNLNNALDRGEPRTHTMRDNPATDFDETGQYWLDNLAPGFFIVREVVPDGYEQTFPPEFACDAIFCIGRGHIVNLEPGKSVDGLDFGNQPRRAAGSIHGVKWVDRNGNAEREDDEPGLAGVRIFSDVNRNGQLDRGEPNTITMRDDPSTRVDETGHYWLEVRPGEHLILEVVPNGYEQTFPNPHRRIAFPFNLGHIVHVPAGGEVVGIDFGNKPLSETGSVHGVKWVDFNGNGKRENLEPGLPDVVIYADLNDNGILDGNEPATKTMHDDLATRLNERGHYWLDGLAAGEYIIREVVPDGMMQTFPAAGTSILSTESVDLPGGRALSYELVGIGFGNTPDNIMGVALTFQVVWPDSCGRLLPQAAKYDVGENRIQIDMYGTQVGDVCLQVLSPEAQTINVGPLPMQDFRVRAVLHESTERGQDFRRSFLIEGAIRVGGDGSHTVKVEPGDRVVDIDFGNRRVDAVPVVELLDAVDFNHDGQLGVADIDMLAAAIRDPDSSEREYDLSGDGEVDADDLDTLVRGVMEIPFGDVNLDGVFNSSDLVRVFQKGEYEDHVAGNSTWADGDFNGDGDFTTADLVFVFQNSNYEVAAKSGESEPLPKAVDIALLDSLLGTVDGRRRGVRAR